MITTIDPCGKYTHMKAKEIRKLCGLIPNWVDEWEQFWPDLSLKHILTCAYNYWPEMRGTIADDLAYELPGDSPLYPLIMMEANGVRFLHYERGIIAVTQNGETHFAGMN